MNDSSNQPQVSIIVPAYNAGAYLRPALLSALRQTCRDIEVLLIDDGSTDGSMETIGDVVDPRLTVVRQPNAGRAAALNRGLDAARGRFYTTVDADDLCAENRVERQVAALREQPELACVFCGYDLILNGRRTAPLFQARTAEECRLLIDRLAMPGHDPTGMYRLSMVGDLRYEEAMKIGAAYDYVLRVGERHPVMVLGECLYSYRAHSGSATRKDPKTRLHYVKEVHRRAGLRRGVPEEQLPQWDRTPIPGKWKNRDYDNNLAARFVESVLCLRRAGRRMEAAMTGLKSAAIHPLDPYYYKPLAYSLLPLNLVRAWRRAPV
ncbi:MAG: glycosyltransferase family 2 protein [Tepidisphaeraceae bacterium]